MIRRTFRAVVVPVVIGAALVACSVSPAAQGASPAATVRTSTATAPPTDPATLAPSVKIATRPHVPSTCHLTKPTQLFVPPAGYPAPAQPPDYYDAGWYGNARLWTMLRHGGEVWTNLPRAAGGFGQKTFWWSTDFDVNHELQPAIRVTGRRLDGPGRFAVPAPGTNAQADFGSAMLIGIEIPASGCWRIMATYRRASLSYVVWVG
jgi:hypothetical protein